MQLNCYLSSDFKNKSSKVMAPSGESNRYDCHREERHSIYPSTCCSATPRGLVSSASYYKCEPYHTNGPATIEQNCRLRQPYTTPLYLRHEQRLNNLFQHQYQRQYGRRKEIDDETDIEYFTSFQLDRTNKKKKRSCFSKKQLQELERHFQENHYVTMDERIRLSNELSLNETQIKIWFQNRRAKGKRIEELKSIDSKEDEKEGAS